MSSGLQLAPLSSPREADSESIDQPWSWPPSSRSSHRALATSSLPAPVRQGYPRPSNNHRQYRHVPTGEEQLMGGETEFVEKNTLESLSEGIEQSSEGLGRPSLEKKGSHTQICASDSDSEEGAAPVESPYRMLHHRKTEREDRLCLRFMRNVDGYLGLPFQQVPSRENARQSSRSSSAKLVLQTLPALLLSVIGGILTGEMLDRIQSWMAFIRVPELFILLPVLMNLKGNLEMNLAARLSTSVSSRELTRDLVTLLVLPQKKDVCFSY